MSEALSFRPMTEADLDAVLKIEYAAYSHPWTRGIFLDGLGKYQIWLMFEGEQQVGHGVVQIILDEAHLLNITVKPENQGRGLGHSGFGLRHAGLGTFHGGAVRGIVNLEQGLARLHIAAFGEQAFLQDASGPGAHLRNP